MIQDLLDILTILEEPKSSIRSAMIRNFRHDLTLRLTALEEISNVLPREQKPNDLSAPRLHLRQAPADGTEPPTWVGTLGDGTDLRIGFDRGMLGTDKTASLTATNKETPNA